LLQLFSVIGVLDNLKRGKADVRRKAAAVASERRMKMLVDSAVVAVTLSQRGLRCCRCCLMTTVWSTTVTPRHAPRPAARPPVARRLANLPISRTAGDKRRLLAGPVPGRAARPGQSITSDAATTAAAPAISETFGRDGPQPGRTDGPPRERPGIATSEDPRGAASRGRGGHRPPNMAT